MGSILFKEMKYTLSRLIDDIDIQEIGLQEIQQPFVWLNSKYSD